MHVLQVRTHVLIQQASSLPLSLSLSLSLSRSPHTELQPVIWHKATVGVMQQGGSKKGQRESIRERRARRLVLMLYHALFDQNQHVYLLQHYLNIKKMNS